jgi:hypothetical protein
MNRYSRIFHHITVEDVKRNTQQDIELKKIKEENMIKKEIYLEKEEVISEGSKSNWRNDLDTDLIKSI